MSDAAATAFEIFPWNQNFETGIEKIDEQHKVLVEILNRLAWHCASSTSELECRHVLDELLSYAAYHFKAEEKVWETALGMQEMVQNHHDGHQMFFVQIQMYRSSDEPEEKVMGDLFNYLTRWLASHILESDRRMALTLKALEHGVPISEARKEVDGQLSGAISVMVSALLEIYDKLSVSTVQLMREKMARLRAEDELARLQHDKLYVALAQQASDHEAQLQFLAYSDPVTGLMNRNGILREIRGVMRQKQVPVGSAALISIDLDNFHKVNARFGEESADRLLGLLARRWREAMAHGGQLARISGDEFVVLLADSGKVEAQLKALRLTAGQPFILDGGSISMAFTAGVVLFPHDGAGDADTVLRQADHTLFRAKQEQKGDWLFLDADEQRQSVERQQLLADIRTGLADNQFRLVYQPKVSMRSGNVIGVEALIRWEHPIKGTLSPIDFLPALEHHPLIIDIGEWVIEQAFRQMTTWDSEGLTLDVGVNIAAMHLQQPGFTDSLAGILARYPHVVPQRLDLEILETAALGELDKANYIIRDCESLGVTFSLDDFGTGYSSLSYLKQLPVKTLKIDQGFVRGALSNADDIAILKGIVGLSKAFDRKLVAEGVDTREHGELLISLGCYDAQGYAIARPMKPEKIAAWKNQWRPYPEWSAGEYATP
ncbi:diguanylate cyclase (GGDEF) domain-containing protein/hemerythrin-like metal-binding domain protein [Marinobacter antarcticus]|uniref:Diguanylate cyclase (GGDEF) domain-containing protein/hemerythrin-like metal-binding domain protein n=1 Tax=Marinobacter antarcticus TaxID=564117 RepID=A0A1M6S7E5_9GAMM|nr:bacteriohemerythrin [Marinobacter antarcticus]SHK40724.1 diguanylate cyclase (GGDEF) domain-containing protein/hemerythrin-like metal-binding domain protein [Marinobacter antarcticus]